MTDTPGQKLKQARLAKSISIDMAANATRIRAHFLAALEADDPEALPSPVQARGFLRNYAAYLGLDPQPLLDIWMGKPLAEAASVTAAPEPVTATLTPDPTPAVDADPQPVDDNPPAQAARADSGARVSAATRVDSQPVQYRAIRMDDMSQARAHSESQAIFEEIGAQLRQRRELLSLSLGEVERHTHVRLHYLKALENGGIDDLPSSVQARGMLSNYAHFLNLDVNELLLRFADALQARRLEKMPAPVATPARRPPARFEPPKGLARFLSFDLIAVGTLVVALVIFAIWGAGQILAAQKETPQRATLPAVAEVLLATPLESPTGELTPSAGSAGTPTLPAPVVAAGDETAVAPPPAANEPIQVYVMAKDHVWMRVTVDGKVLFTGRAQRSSAYPFAGNNTIEIVTGDAAALQVFYNQADLGLLGARGEVIDIVFTPKGAQTPTPTITPTVTRTPLPQPTSPASPTPRPTATLKP